MMKRPLRIAAALIAVAITAAACSSGTSSTSTTTTPKFKGAPIVVGQILPLTGAALTLPQLGASMKAAVNYYNSIGGLQGHKLVLDQCDSQDSADVEAQCAQQLVNDHTVAEIGGVASYNVTAVQSTLDNCERWSNPGARAGRKREHSSVKLLGRFGPVDGLGRRR